MAKDGKGKKDKKNKVPKEIGGVKVPKKLRKLGNEAAKLAREPVVAEVVAGALLAAAAALREGKDPKGTIGAALKGGAKTAVGGGMGKAGSEGGGDGVGVRLSDSLKLMALDFARRALEPREKTGEAADAPVTPAAPPVSEVPQRVEEPMLGDTKGKTPRGN
jgi:hypothetical protein